MLLRDELLFAWLTPAGRDRVTEAIYAEQSTFAPGGIRYRQGLFGWERSVVESTRFPRAGRVLIGGAGGGREVAALRALGYDVVAFDPCAALVERGREAAGADPGVAFARGSYGDLVRAVGGEPSPLAAVLDGRAFDAVVLGWSSFSHVAESADRLALLRALRTLAPAAPVLLSFWKALPEEALTSRAGRLRRAVRRVCAVAGAPSARRPGDMFVPHAGFIYGLTAAEVERAARDAGYDVAHLTLEPEPHALLVPMG